MNNSPKKMIPAIRFKGFSDDWKQRKLGELMEVTSVKRIHQSDWTNHGVRFLRARDIVSAAKSEAPADFLYISEKKYNEFSNVCGKVQVGDLLVTGVGSIGIPLLIDHEEPLYFKDGNVIWFKNQNKIDGQFFYYSFVGRNIQKYIRDVAGIGTVGTYTIDSGKKTPISLPRREEQQKIGSFFKRLDDAIALHQSKLNNFKKLKRGLLQFLFTNSDSSIPMIRFKNFAKKWEKCKLGKLATFSKGSGYSKSDLRESGTPIILYGRLYTNYETIIEDVDTYVIEKEKSVISKGNEVIVPASGETAEDISRASVVARAGIILAGDLNIIKPGNKIDSAFLALTISNGSQKKELSKRAQGKSIVHLHNSDLKEVLLVFPSVEEQQRISLMFEQLDKVINIHKSKIQYLKNIKVSLLQRMFI